MVDTVVLVKILEGSWAIGLLSENPARKQMVQAMETAKDIALGMEHLQKLQQ